MADKLDRRLVVMIDAKTHQRITAAAKKAKVSLGEYVRQKLGGAR